VTFTVRCSVVVLSGFYHAMHFTAKCGLGIACRLSVRLSVCLSVRPSVTLVDCDYICWNSSKIISPSVSMGCSLFATKHHWSTPRGTSQNFCPNRGAVLKTWLSAHKRLNRKLYTHFRLVPKSMTLDDREGSLCTLFQNMCIFRSSL